MILTAAEDNFHKVGFRSAIHTCICTCASVDMTIPDINHLNSNSWFGLTRFIFRMDFMYYISDMIKKWIGLWALFLLLNPPKLTNCTMTFQSNSISSHQLRDLVDPCIGLELTFSTRLINGLALDWILYMLSKVPNWTHCHPLASGGYLPIYILMTKL